MEAKKEKSQVVRSVKVGYKRVKSTVVRSVVGPQQSAYPEPVVRVSVVWYEKPVQPLGRFPWR